MSFFLYIVGRNGEGVQYIGEKKVNFLSGTAEQKFYRGAVENSRWSLEIVVIDEVLSLS